MLKKCASFFNFDKVKGSFSQTTEKRQRVELVMSIVLLVAVTTIACNMEKMVEKESESKKDNGIYTGKTIILDPGHGGVDPGKIGVNKILEKDINLQISLKLQEILEKDGFNVVMTRNDDQGLYNEGDSNKKVSDMRKRCQLVNDTYSNHPDAMVISIHQNSFTSESVSGAQVFYYIKSDRAKQYADIMQDVLNENINIDKPKRAKENKNYYLLLHTDCPAMIIECGFLSNWEEATNLADTEYQHKMAEIIHNGIIECIDANAN